MPEHTRVFLLSPANLSGARAAQLLRRDPQSDLASRLRSRDGASIAEICRFISGLYFRGKLEYATRFARAPGGVAGVHVIVPGLGLRSPTEAVDLREFRRISKVRVDAGSRRYLAPLARDADRLAAGLPADAEAVLLGSIATAKYVRPLVKALGDRLRVPRELIGLGMMRRGALLRRSAERGRELVYVPVPRRVSTTAGIAK